MSRLPLVCLLVLLTGCQSLLFSKERDARRMQTRLFEGAPPDAIFRTFRSVLQSEGHRIKGQDENAGVLVVALQRRAVGGLLWNKWSRFSDPSDIDEMELSINIESAELKRTRCRLSLIRMEKSKFGGYQGKEIVDDSVYRSLYEVIASRLSLKTGGDDSQR